LENYAGEILTTYKYGTTRPNRYDLNRVISGWKSNETSWDAQPEVDTNTSIVTKDLSPEGNTENYDSFEINVTDILLEAGKLKSDFNGISGRCHDESLDGYLRRMTFATNEFEYDGFQPTLKVEYALPVPQIVFNNNTITVSNVTDLEKLFPGKVVYHWDIDGNYYEGKSVNITRNGDCNVTLRVEITNNLGEMAGYELHATYLASSTVPEQEQPVKIIRRNDNVRHFVVKSKEFKNNMFISGSEFQDVQINSDVFSNNIINASWKHVSVNTEKVENMKLLGDHNVSSLTISGDILSNATLELPALIEENKLLKQLYVMNGSETYLEYWDVETLIRQIEKL
jgi:hypothetical protein